VICHCDEFNISDNSHLSAGLLLGFSHSWYLSGNTAAGIQPGLLNASQLEGKLLLKKGGMS